MGNTNARNNDKIDNDAKGNTDDEARKHQYGKYCGVYVEDLSFEERLEFLKIILK